MSDLIAANAIAGDVIYGVQQYDYTIEGISGKDYIAALTTAAFKESVAIEDSAEAYAVVVRQRQRKVADLGDVLAVLAMAIATMPTSGNDRVSENVPRLDAAVSIANSYGIKVNVDHKDGKTTITYGNAYGAQNDIQYALDTEDNNLKQDNVALQSLLSKRDSAYSAAAKLVKKGDGTGSGIIRNIS